MIFNIPGNKHPQKTDEEYIHEFRSTGSLEILGALYATYMHLVYGVCLKYLKDREESKDAVMQIFEKLITEVQKHKIQNFRSWLYVLTKNFCLMQLRAQKSGSERLNEWINDPIIFMENTQVMHPIDDIKPDLEAELIDCIERLKDGQKECIKQFYFENRCYNDISVRLGLDRETSEE